MVGSITKSLLIANLAFVSFGIARVIVGIDNKDIVVVDEVFLISIALMGIQVDYHDFVKVNSASEVMH